MAVYLVGANRIDVLAVVAVRRDPAWIETTVSERAVTSERSANSPQEVRRRPSVDNDAQRSRDGVAAGQMPFSGIDRL